MSSKAPAKEAFLSIVAIGFFSLAIVWLLPDCETKKRIMEPVRSAFLFWGLNQHWALFSPTIRNINYHTVAVVTYANGMKTIWEAPRMDKLDAWSKFQKEKYRKWSIDTLPWPDHREFWPSFARHVGRELDNPGNPPVQFSLLLYWTEIPAPKGGLLTEQSHLPPHKKVSHVFTYRYTPEDLR